MPIKAYKGFNKDMTCRGFQFEEGKSYEEPKAKLCESGFHACLNPLDCFRYYSPTKSEFHEVELDGVSDERENDTKICAKKIKIGAKIFIKNIISAGVDFIFEKTKDSDTAASSGDWSTAASSGDRSTAASSGEESTAASSGYRSTAASSGDWSTAASSGYRSTAASSGNGSTAASSGEESTAASSNKNAIAVACGKNAKAKGVIGSYIVLTEWNNEQTELLHARMERIDGETLKPDVWYKLENGEFVECEE